MVSDRWHIRARIELLPSDGGGRKTVLRGPVSYRPNHNFLDAANRDMAIGSIDLTDGQDIVPGTSLEVDMTLLIPHGVAWDLTVGRVWRLQEAMRLVGWGTILKLLADRP